MLFYLKRNLQKVIKRIIIILGNSSKRMTFRELVAGEN